MFTNVLALILAYLFGSISSAIIVCKIMGLPDPRMSGSHNPGATNVLRIGNKMAAALTLSADILKGIVPVVVAYHYGFNPSLLSLIGLAAVVGHIFPIFFGFAGGKGVATALGVIATLSWVVAGAWIVTWGAVLLLFRYVSLASIFASLLLPVYIWLVFKNPTMTLIMAAMSLLLIFRHWPNILRLRQGIESRLF